MSQKNESEKKNLQEIKKLLNKSEQKILLQWYDEELKKEVGGSVDDLVGTVDNLREAFMNWAEQVNLHSLLCSQWSFQAMKEKYKTRIHLTIAISELIATSQGYHAPLTLAVIIVQWAGDKLCDGQQ